MSVEVDAAVVETSLQKQKSAASKEFKETLSHDVERFWSAAPGRTLSSCAEVKLVGGCEHELAKMHCPQTCGLCGALASQAGAMNRRSLDKCTGT